jgi:hypothetical protein
VLTAYRITSHVLYEAEAATTETAKATTATTAAL